MIEIACRYGKPVRIGVNWGSLDQDLLTRMMDENSQAAANRAGDRGDARGHRGLGARQRQARRRARPCGAIRIVISAKVSGVQDLIAVYRNLAARCNYPLHLGLTEAGMGSKGIVASTAGIGVLLQQGIGDTIRVSLTPEPGRRSHPGGHRRAGNPADHGAALVHADGDRLPGLRPHHQHLFPGARAEDPGPHPPSHARMAQAPRGRRGHDGGRDGLRRQRPGREQAREHRHQPAGHRRASRGAGLRGWRQDGDAEGRAHRRGVPGARRALRRAHLRAGIRHERFVRHANARRARAASRRSTRREAGALLRRARSRVAHLGGRAERCSARSSSRTSTAP